MVHRPVYFDKPIGVLKVKGATEVHVEMQFADEKATCPGGSAQRPHHARAIQADSVFLASVERMASCILTGGTTGVSPLATVEGISSMS